MWLNHEIASRYTWRGTVTNAQHQTRGVCVRSECYGFLSLSLSPFCIRPRNSIVANRARTHKQTRLCLCCAMYSFVVCSLAVCRRKIISRQLNKSHQRKNIWFYDIRVGPIRIHSTQSLTYSLRIWFRTDLTWALGARSRCMECGIVDERNANDITTYSSANRYSYAVRTLFFGWTRNTIGTRDWNEQICKSK